MSVVRHEPPRKCPVCGEPQRWVIELRAGWQGYEHTKTGLTSCDRLALIKSYIDGSEAIGLGLDISLARELVAMIEQGV